MLTWNNEEHFAESSKNVDTERVNTSCFFDIVSDSFSFVNTTLLWRHQPRTLLLHMILTCTKSNEKVSFIPMQSRVQVSVNKISIRIRTIIILFDILVFVWENVSYGFAFDKFASWKSSSDGLDWYVRLIDIVRLKWKQIFVYWFLLFIFI